MGRPILYAIMAVLFITAGCVRHGHYFDSGEADSFRPGITTAQDATAALGKPVARSNYPNGNYLLQWYYVEGNLFGGSGSHVAILFNSDDKMIRMSHKYQNQ